MEAKHVIPDGKRFNSKVKRIVYEEDEEMHHAKYMDFVAHVFGIEIDEYEIHKTWPYINTKTKKISSQKGAPPVYRMEIPMSPAQCGQEPEYYDDPDEVVYVMCEYPYLSEPIIMIDKEVTAIFDIRFLYPFKKEDIKKVEDFSKNSLELTQKEMDCIDFWGEEELEKACEQEGKFAIPVQLLERISTFPMTGSIWQDFKTIVDWFLCKNQRDYL